MSQMLSLQLQSLYLVHVSYSIVWEYDSLYFIAIDQ